MKTHVKKLRPLLLLMALFMLTNCQEEYTEGAGHNHEAENSNIIRKPFSEFKKLPDLMEKTLQKGMQKSNDTLDIYDFKIDSTRVVEVTTDHGQFYTMAITRNFDYPVKMFENLVICDYGTSQEAFIMSYKPDPEYYIREQNHDYPGFVGGLGTTRIDYNSLQKTVITNCVTINVLVCALLDTPHKVGDSCQLSYKQVTNCKTWIIDSPMFTDLSNNFFSIVTIGKALSGSGST